MSITASQVATLREKTGAGMMDAKRALEEAHGDEATAIDILRAKGMKAVEKRQDRTAKEGIVESYIHANGKVGVMLVLACETDFVARNDEFKALAHDVALHVAAMDPKFMRPEDVPADVIEREKAVYREQLKSEGKPEAMWDKISEGKLQKFYKDVCLMKQAFVKDDTKTIEGLITEATAKMGEKIELKEYSRMSIS